MSQRAKWTKRSPYSLASTEYGLVVVGGSGFKIRRTRRPIATDRNARITFGGGTQTVAGTHPTMASMRNGGSRGVLAFRDDFTANARNHIKPYDQHVARAHIDGRRTKCRFSRHIPVGRRKTTEACRWHADPTTNLNKQTAGP
jgi:hypothetical protein